MKISLASGLGILALLAAMTVLFVLERRNRDLALEAQARAEALEREVAVLKTGRASAEDQQKRFTELSLAFADRAAQKYGLTDEQRQALTEVLRLGREKVNGMVAQLEEFRRRGDVDGIASALNQLNNEYKAWRLEQLTKHLGPELAQRVDPYEDGALGDWGRIEASQQIR